MAVSSGLHQQKQRNPRAKRSTRLSYYALHFHEHLLGHSKITAGINSRHGRLRLRQSNVELSAQQPNATTVATAAAESTVVSSARNMVRRHIPQDLAHGSVRGRHNRVFTRTSTQVTVAVNQYKHQSLQQQRDFIQAINDSHGNGDIEALIASGLLQQNLYDHNARRMAAALDDNTQERQQLLNLHSHSALAAAATPAAAAYPASATTDAYDLSTTSSARPVASGNDSDTSANAANSKSVGSTINAFTDSGASPTNAATNTSTAEGTVQGTATAAHGHVTDIDLATPQPRELTPQEIASVFTSEDDDNVLSQLVPKFERAERKHEHAALHSNRAPRHRFTEPTDSAMRAQVSFNRPVTLPGFGIYDVKKRQVFLDPPAVALLHLDSSFSGKWLTLRALLKLLGKEITAQIFEHIHHLQDPLIQQRYKRLAGERFSTDKGAAAATIASGINNSTGNSSSTLPDTGDNHTATTGSAATTSKHNDAVSSTAENGAAASSADAAAATAADAADAKTPAPSALQTAMPTLSGEMALSGSWLTATGMALPEQAATSPASPVSSILQAFQGIKPHNLLAPLSASNFGFWQASSSVEANANATQDITPLYEHIATESARGRESTTFAIFVTTAAGQREKLYLRLNGFFDHEHHLTHASLTLTRIGSRLFEQMPHVVADSASFDWLVPTDECLYGRNYYTILGYRNNDPRVPYRQKQWQRVIVHPDDIATYKKEKLILQDDSAGNAFELLYRSRCRDGSYIWTKGVGTVIARDQGHHATRILGINIDINRVLEGYEQLQNKVFTDILTGLKNRTYLITHMEQFIYHATGPLTILFADVTALKVYNDYLGHAVGDKLLCSAAILIKGAINRINELIRISGDELICLLPNCSLQEGEQVARKITLARSQYNLNAPIRMPVFFSVGGTTVDLSAYAGRKLKAEEKEEAMALFYQAIQEADALMQQNKRLARVEHYSLVKAYIERSLNQTIEIHDKRLL